MSERNFQRNIENFTCAKCGRSVEGNGYTNHCPECLTSMHVDVNPGDRSSECGGVMEPVGVEFKDSIYRIKHHCTKCGFTRMNKVVEGDNFDEVIRISGLVANK